MALMIGHDAVPLLVVRHAEQERDGQDGPLTARGRLQAAAVAGVVALAPGDLLVTSSRLRARQTADAIGPGAMVLSDLDEFRFGPGWSWSHADAREDLTLWRPDDRAGDESLAEFHLRVGRALDYLVTRHVTGRIVLCVHSGVIDTILRWAWGISPDAPWTTEVAVGHASITEMRHWPRGRHPRGAPRFTVLDRLGEVSHLPADLVTGQ